MNFGRVCLLLVLTVFSGWLIAADDDLLRSDLNLDRVVNNYDFATLANEWLNSGEPYAPVTKPFPGPAELRCDQTQRNYLAAGQSETIFNLNDGPAIVTNFWMAFSVATKVREIPIKIYFDGHTQPDINGVTGDIFASGTYQPANFRGDFVGVTNSQETGEASGYPGFSGYLRLLMPYYSSIKIDIKNPAPTGGYSWMMLERLPIDPNRLYNVGIKPGMYLKTSGDANRVEHYSEVTLLDTNTPTILAGIYQCFENSTALGGGGNRYYLEGDHRIYYGGSSTPSYRSSGAEDFYHSSWYFQEGVFDRMDECLVVKNNTNYVASRFFPLHRAPYSENGIKFTWQVGEEEVADPNSPYIRWIIWYYE